MRRVTEESNGTGNLVFLGLQSTISKLVDDQSQCLGNSFHEFDYNRLEFQHSSEADSLVENT